MTAKRRQDGRWVLDTATRVAESLKRKKAGTSLRVRIPQSCVQSGDTKGWCVSIGDLGKGRPKLQVWFDTVSGAPGRKLYAGFYSPETKVIDSLVKQVSRELCPVRTITDAETSGENIFSFSERISRDEYNEPILEKYITGDSYFGIFDPTRPTQERINRHFCERAVAFFLDVAEIVGGKGGTETQRGVYPDFENRRVVASHLRRERSAYLAMECKIRDDFECQVCEFRFEEHYGILGRDFAEAHHRIPLGKQTGKVRTRLEDLVTVCANCHRMLHRMEGKAGDVEKLRRIVRTNRKR